MHIADVPLAVHKMAHANVYIGAPTASGTRIKQEQASAVLVQQQ